MNCLKHDTRVIISRNKNKVTADKAQKNRAKDSTFEVFLDYSRSLSNERRFTEAISILSICSKLMPDLPMENVKLLVSDLLQSYSLEAGKVGWTTDPWSCVFCTSVLEEPVTLTCGHSCCKKCLLKDLSTVCKKCKVKYDPIEEDPIDVEAYVKIDILVCDLVKKFWSKDLEATKLRNLGNKLFQRGAVEESIAKYTEAIELAPDDHLSLSNRSNAYQKCFQYEAALKDSEKSIEIKPDWSKAHFRKGVALAGLGRFEEAIIELFHCYLLEDSCSKMLRMEMVKVFHQLITARGQEETEEKVSQASLYSESEEEEDGEDEGEDAEEDDVTLTRKLVKKNKKLLIAKNRRLTGVLAMIDQAVKGRVTNPPKLVPRPLDPQDADRDDFDCSLCFRMLHQPATTPCGHTFCKSCIDRSLDHKQECPLCKTQLRGFQSNIRTNEFVEETIRRIFPADYAERQRGQEEEMNDLTKASQDGKHHIPIFVCTVSYPNMPCPLHVFEPKYRLMIRRAMENGTRQFGMCLGSDQHEFSEYGTILEIRDIQYFSDGRSVVDTIGGRRFKVLERGNKDGYHTATVEYLQDLPPEGNQLPGLKEQHDKIHSLASTWFRSMTDDIRAGVLSHYGEMPPLEWEYWRLQSGPAWCWWVLAILPLDHQAQQQILSQTNLIRRLEAIGRILGYMKRRGCF